LLLTTPYCTSFQLGSMGLLCPCWSWLILNTALRLMGVH